MKISRAWLQTFFEQPLPDAQALSDALTFHAFEIDGVDTVDGDDVLDVKVTPNRGHDALSHRGIAKELAAILQLPLANDPFTDKSDLPSGKSDLSVSVAIQNNDLCKRYVAGYITGVKVGPSPEWLKTRLEAIGQRSINNVVDATNYVMFNLGQPLHAFDARKLTPVRGETSHQYSIAVRAAKQGEKVLALDEKEYTLSDSMLVIVDGSTDTPIGIAGVKGGMPAGITEATQDIIIESANFDGVSVRKTAQALKLRTDASQRFEQGISSELAGWGMREVVDLILAVAGGNLSGFFDVYPQPEIEAYVAVTLTQVQNALGSTFGEKEINDSFTRLGFHYVDITDPPHGGGILFGVDAPIERLDLVIAEDLIEEVGRMQGYDKVPAIELPPFPKEVEVNKNFATAERLREQLVSEGYSEVFTSVFADKGERVVLNKVDGVRPYLRDSLVAGLTEALKKNTPNKDLLGLKEIKLFEIGTVWKGGKEVMLLGKITEKGPASEEPIAADESPAAALPISQTQRYQPFSKYPYIVRDVAVWTPTGTDERHVAEMIKHAAGGPPAEGVLQDVRLFDRFEKDGKTSLAYRLIFQSFDRTLTDDEVNALMEKVYTVLKAKGFEIR